MKKIAIIIIAIGVIGFFYFTQAKNENNILEKVYTSKSQNKDILEIQAGNSYIVSFWAENEGGSGFSEWPKMKAQINISSNGEKLFTEKIEDIGSDDNGGVRRAEEYTEFKYKAKRSEKLTIETLLIEGDKCELKIYQNLDDEANIMPGVSIIVAFIGIIIYLKKRKS